MDAVPEDLSNIFSTCFRVHHRQDITSVHFTCLHITVWQTITAQNTHNWIRINASDSWNKHCFGNVENNLDCISTTLQNAPSFRKSSSRVLKRENRNWNIVVTLWSDDSSKGLLCNGDISNSGHMLHHESWSSSQFQNNIALFNVVFDCALVKIWENVI